MNFTIASGFWLGMGVVLVLMVAYVAVAWLIPPRNKNKK